jgi:hypothetical protein
MPRPSSAARRRRLRAPLAPLGMAVSAPGTFDIILPVHIDYDTVRQSIMMVIDAAPKGNGTIRDVQIYPPSGKFVYALRVARTSESDSSAGEWVYLSAAPQVDADRQTPANFPISAQPWVTWARCLASANFSPNCDDSST